ncbi:hypothetical protein DRP98_00275 [candidate division KSB1 bacterium]|nr:MAG: hypothetical protein DRQ12_01895 [candidate division KSB1 bacterium]RKY86483.1 MAG: hypothetical protein DRP98_00275 [candidate division KSB1 bacterium]
MNIHVGRVLVLGGAGLVGAQVVRQIARDLKPELIVIASRYQREVREALRDFHKEFPDISFEGCWGNVFVRKQFADKTRKEILESLSKSRVLFQDVFGDKSATYQQSQLVDIIRSFKPEVIVDSINTATAISYQDVYTTSLEVENILNQIQADDRSEQARPLEKVSIKKLEHLLVSQSIPQLIRHVQLLWEAMVEVGTRIYVKIGTTGTGGMGLNIPYTHSEDKPSANLMTKTAVAFAHTGLLFLMARTPGGPIVKEIKPGAMIGYRKIEYRAIRRDGKPAMIYESQMEPLGNTVDISFRTGYNQKGELMMVGVDTGENGFFTLGEFEAITSLYQMEFVTPEEIAQNVVLEIMGSNTGKDVIAAIDGAIMDPSYRAGYLRRPVLEEMKRLEKKTNSHSVALGQLGPPELSKLLYEAHLLKIRYKTLQNVLDAEPEAISRSLYNYVRRSEIRNVIVSVGIPILTPDGKQLIRGPFINIPEYRGEFVVQSTPEQIDRWAKKGWVDLRPKNFVIWQDRFRQMLRSTTTFLNEGSTAITLRSYLSDEINIGEVVGWIFNNDPQIKGYRIKAL